MLLGRQCAILIHHRSPVASLGMMISSQYKNLFTNSYWNVDDLEKRRERGRIRISNPVKFKAKVRRTFEGDGLKDIYEEDLENLIDFADSKEDILLISSILRTSLQEKNRSLPLKPKLVSWFLALCKFMNHAELAKEFWRDPDVRRTRLLDSCYLNRGVYFTLLYDNQLYKDVVEDIEAILPQCSKNDIILAMASLCQINTEDSFRKATIFAQRYPGNKNGYLGMRSMCCYAYFAVKRKEFGIAYEILTNRVHSKDPCKFSFNLKLLILIEVNRIEQALLLIRAEILHRHHNKKQMEVSFEVMDKLSKKIREEYHSSSSHVAKEFASICEVLENTAKLCDESVEDFVFEPIEEMSEQEQKLKNQSHNILRKEKLKRMKRDLNASDPLL